MSEGWSSRDKEYRVVTHQTGRRDAAGAKKRLGSDLSDKSAEHKLAMWPWTLIILEQPGQPETPARCDQQGHMIVPQPVKLEQLLCPTSWGGVVCQGEAADGAKRRNSVEAFDFKFLSWGEI